MSKHFLPLKIAILGSSIFLAPIVHSAAASALPSRNYLAQSSCQVQRGNSYKVRLGDTLSGIANNHNMNLNQILCLNPSLRGNPNLILVGQQINVGRSTQARSTYRNSSPRNTWQPKPVFVPKPTVNRASNQTSPTPPPSRTTTNTPSRTNTTAPVSDRRRVSAWNFNLPNQIRRGSNRMGATRGGPACYTNKNDTARSLIPKTNFGYTLRDYPTFFWYQPELIVASVPVEFKLLKPREDNPKIWERVYQTEFTNSTAGIVSFTLPTDAPPLEAGKEYKWQIKIGCKSNVFTIFNGNIERLSPNNPQLESKFANAAIEDYPAILAEQGIWYDILPTMSAILAKNPNDPRTLENWSEILQKIGYQDLSQLPSIQPSR